MEAYKAETAEILRRFMDNRISHPQCLAALDAALSDLVPRMNPSDLRTVQGWIKNDSGVIVKEMRRRTRMGNRRELPDTPPH